LIEAAQQGGFFRLPVFLHASGRNPLVCPFKSAFASCVSVCILRL
jgi:hypothetical protein